MVRTTTQPDNVFSLAATNDLENRGKDVIKHAEAIAEALQELAATKQIFAEDRGIDEMQAVISAARNLSALLDGDRPAIDHDNADFCEQARLQRGMLRAPELPSLAQMMGAA